MTYATSPLRNGNLEFGTWNLELGTWNLELGILRLNERGYLSRLLHSSDYSGNE